MHVSISSPTAIRARVARSPSVNSSSLRITLGSYININLAWPPHTVRRHSSVLIPSPLQRPPSRCQLHTVLPKPQAPHPCLTDTSPFMCIRALRNDTNNINSPGFPTPHRLCTVSGHPPGHLRSITSIPTLFMRRTAYRPGADSS